MLVPDTAKLKQVAKKGKDEILGFVFSYVMTSMNEIQLLDLEKNVAGLDQNDANESDLMNILFTKILLRRRHMYISFLKYKIEKNEDIQMTENQYHQALLKEEKARKTRSPLQKILEALGFREPRLLRDEAIPEYLFAQEKLVADLKKKNRVFQMNYRFTEQFCLTNEVNKLKQKYHLFEREYLIGQNVITNEQIFDKEDTKHFITKEMLKDRR